MSVKATDDIVRVGDIVFTRWIGKDSDMTCRLTGDNGVPGKAAHVEMIDRVCPFFGPRILAASAFIGKMIRWDWEKRKAYLTETKTEWCRWSRLDPFTPDQIMEIGNEAEKQFCTFKYSKAELPLQAIDGWRAKFKGLHPQDEEAVWARKLGDLWQGGVICSKAGCLPFIRIGVFPAHARFWSPSDVLRYIDCGASGWGLAEKTAGW